VTEINNYAIYRLEVSSTDSSEIELDFDVTLLFNRETGDPTEMQAVA
jgi:hypothetical protein